MNLSHHNSIKVKDALTLLTRWRILKEGIEDECGNIIVYSPIDAAAKIGAPLRLLQNFFRLFSDARAYGFDFNAHKERNIAFLKRFVHKLKQNDISDATAYSSNEEP